MVQLVLREDTGASATCVWAKVKESISDLSLVMMMSLSSRAVFMSSKADSYFLVCSVLASLGVKLNFPLTQGVSLTAGNWLLDLKTEAGTHAALMAGEITAVDSIEVQRVVVVATAVAVAGLEKAGPLETIVVQPLVVAVSWGDAVVTIVAVVVGVDLDMARLLSISLASQRLSGKIIFPS